MARAQISPRVFFWGGGIQAPSVASETEHKTVVLVLLLAQAPSWCC